MSRPAKAMKKGAAATAVWSLTICGLAALACSSGSNPPPPTGGTGGVAGGTGGRPSSGTGGVVAGTGGTPVAGTGGVAGGTGGAPAPGTGGRGRGDAGPAPDTGGGTTPETGAEAAPPPVADPGLDKACTPTFKLVMADKGPKGQLFTDAVGGNAEAFVQDIGRKVCRVLYRSASEVRGANSIELTIKDYDGVAGKWGDVGEIGVEISTRHLQNVKNEGRDVAAEIAGILHHEMTHMYQHDDKPEATFPDIANMYESIADGVRIRNGFAPAGCAPTSKGGTWSSHSYCSGGWFWLWAETVYPGFIYKLNAQMKGKDGKPWSPAEATVITGKSIDALWTEYKGAACCSGNNRSCCTVLPR